MKRLTLARRPRGGQPAMRVAAVQMKFAPTVAGNLAKIKVALAAAAQISSLRIRPLPADDVTVIDGSHKIISSIPLSCLMIFISLR